MDSKLFADSLKTKIFGHSHLHLDETKSTNSYAVELFKNDKLVNGMVITADKQTEGRGRLERSWLSEGCLTMTIALEFPKKISNLSTITLTAGAAVTMGISNLAGKRFQVKYPNDILYEGKKVGGILSEVKFNDSTFVLIGIGINVEQESFPEEIADIAVSLKQLGVSTTREEVAGAIINELEPMVHNFFEKGFKAIRPFWLDANCTIGHEWEVTQVSGKVWGKALDVDEDGALILGTANGEKKITTGDFRMRKL